MKDDKSIGSIEVPEADAVEQQQAADFDDETTPDTAHLTTTGREVNEADLIDQATPVTDSDDEWDYDR